MVYKKGKLHPHYGKPCSESRRAAISKAHKKRGTMPPNVGKFGSEHPRWKGGPIKYNCEMCEAKFEDYRKGRRFCSKQCQYEAAKLGKTGNWKGGLLTHICEMCGSSFEDYREEARFCSHECYTKIPAEQTANWQGGKSFEPYCPKFNEERKEEIRNRNGRNCQLCGKSEILNGERLIVHHIDGDKMQGCDGKSFYLSALCRSCHSKKDDLEKEFLIVVNV